MNKTAEWVLRIAVAGEFLGHGIFAAAKTAEAAAVAGYSLLFKKAWIGWMITATGVSAETATQMLLLIGLADIVVAVLMFVKPVRAALLWAAVWGLWTALVRPLIGGESVLEFVERFANWGAPLALLLLFGWPRSIRGWFR